MVYPPRKTRPPEASVASAASYSAVSQGDSKLTLHQHNRHHPTTISLPKAFVTVRQAKQLW